MEKEEPTSREKEQLERAEEKQLSVKVRKPREVLGKEGQWVFPIPETLEKSGKIKPKRLLLDLAANRLLRTLIRMLH